LARAAYLLMRELVKRLRDPARLLTNVTVITNLG
jgi:hypothetical protein